ncbi:MAG TPA: tRNA 2-selenouridine(34) synthase MnmH, partial [Gammaproteobacteria bacterium]|nr:tRNA 2-selenouridine(34) synthase MnmH [Gammaproteobacteria bacterium]
DQGESDGFYPVVEELLVGYYDPMYDYQIQKKMKRVVFKGNADEVLAYLAERSID